MTLPFAACFFVTLPLSGIGSAVDRGGAKSDARGGNPLTGHVSG